MDPLQKQLAAAMDIPADILFGHIASPLDYPCSRCGAVPGMICDRATLTRKEYRVRREYHYARVQAYEAEHPTQALPRGFIPVRPWLFLKSRMRGRLLRRLKARMMGSPRRMTGRTRIRRIK